MRFRDRLLKISYWEGGNLVKIDKQTSIISKEQKAITENKYAEKCGRTQCGGRLKEIQKTTWK